MRQFFLIFIIAAFIFSCNSGKKRSEDSDKPVVTVSILPQRTFIEKIAGNDFAVNVLIPPGASPATYTLLPSQLKHIARSEVWFRIGYIGFEHSWKDKIAQANREMKVVDLSEGLDLIGINDPENGNGKGVRGVDPHIWMSPSLVKKICLRITEVLSDLNPEKKSLYYDNYQKFTDEIDRVDREIEDALKDYRGYQFITFHPSLSYYAREYGLVQHSLESGGKEPTPRHMAEVVKLAKKEGIRIIYIQSDLDREQARVFAEEIDGNIVEVWPLNPEWSENMIEISNILIDNF